MRDIRPITIAILLHHVKELRRAKRLFNQVPPLRTRARRGACFTTDACARPRKTSNIHPKQSYKELRELSGQTASHISILTSHYYYLKYLKIPVELRGFEPRTPALQRQCSSQLSYSPSVTVVGLGGLEPPTSRLSGVRSNHLSYKPLFEFAARAVSGRLEPPNFPTHLSGRSNHLSYKPPSSGRPRLQAEFAGCGECVTRRVHSQLKVQIRLFATSDA